MQFALQKNGSKSLERHEQALRYYQEVFGLKIVKESEKWAELSAEGCRLTVYKGDPTEVESENSLFFEGCASSPDGTLEEGSGRWQRDPFGLAFRWTLC